MCAARSESVKETENESQKPGADSAKASTGQEEEDEKDSLFSEQESERMSLH